MGRHQLLKIWIALSASVGLGGSLLAHAQALASPSSPANSVVRGAQASDQRLVRPSAKGSLGMGLAAVSDWSTEYPFLDFTKQARPWISQQEGKAWGAGDPLELDQNGWVRSLKRGQRADLLFLTTTKDALPYSRFSVTYKGKGRVGYRSAARKLISESRPNHDVVDVTGMDEDYAILSIEQTDPSDPIREISIVPIEHLDAYRQGNVFNPDWLKHMTPFRAMRFMNWTQTNDTRQQRWNERPRVQDYTWVLRGVPWEIIIDLANKLGAEPWVNVPHLADDEYTRELADLFRTRLAPGLRIYVEHSNEVWNWRFPQAQHANVAGKGRWGGDVGDAFMQWHGVRTAEICDIWKQQVFAGDARRVHCVLGVQAGWRGLEKAALECPKWVGEGHAPCYKHGIDSLGIAAYFSGCLDGDAGWKKADRTEQIRGWFRDPDGGLDRAFGQLIEGSQFECADTVRNMAATYEYFKKTAEQYGLVIVAYEGGQHVTGNGSKIQDDPAFIAFHLAINRDPRMGVAYRKNLEAWKKAGGTLFVHYFDIGKPSKWGSWGALESLRQATSPKWQALTDFSLNQGCWWSGCDRTRADGP